MIPRELIRIRIAGRHITASHCIPVSLHNIKEHIVDIVLTISQNRSGCPVAHSQVYHAVNRYRLERPVILQYYQIKTGARRIFYIFRIDREVYTEASLHLSLELECYCLLDSPGHLHFFVSPL